MGQEPLIENGCKRLTRRDTEQICWQRVPTCGITRQTHQGTEHAHGQWGILPGKDISYMSKLPHRSIEQACWQWVLILMCFIMLNLYLFV